jgi:hypothetical protein
LRELPGSTSPYGNPHEIAPTSSLVLWVLNAVTHRKTVNLDQPRHLHALIRSPSATFWGSRNSSSERNAGRIGISPFQKSLKGSNATLPKMRCGKLSIRSRGSGVLSSQRWREQIFAVAKCSGYTSRISIWRPAVPVFLGAFGVDRRSRLKPRAEIGPWISNLLWLKYCAGI